MRLMYQRRGMNRFPDNDVNVSSYAHRTSQKVEFLCW